MKLKKINSQRSTCILCGKKRYHNYLKSFYFITWITPIKKTKTLHYACYINIGYNNYNKETCINKLLYSNFQLSITIN
jgi:hypothetical protein